MDKYRTKEISDMVNWRIFEHLIIILIQLIKNINFITRNKFLRNPCNFFYNRIVFIIIINYLCDS
jgi:hypothetical protein